MSQTNFTHEIVSNTITAIGTLSAAYITNKFKNSHKKEKRDVLKNQFYNVYLPLFKITEPYLYKEPTDTFLKTFFDKFKEIRENYYELIDCNLLNDVSIMENEYLMSSNVSAESFEDVCSILERHFENSRKKLFLPTRKWYYKLNTKQFNQQTLETIDYVGKTILQGLMLITLGALISFTLNLITPFIDQVKSLILAILIQL